MAPLKRSVMHHSPVLSLLEISFNASPVIIRRCRWILSRQAGGLSPLSALSEDTHLSPPANPSPITNWLVLCQFLILGLPLLQGSNLHGFWRSPTLIFSLAAVLVLDGTNLETDRPSCPNPFSQRAKGSQPDGTGSHGEDSLMKPMIYKGLRRFCQKSLKYLPREVCTEFIRH